MHWAVALLFIYIGMMIAPCNYCFWPRLSPRFSPRQHDRASGYRIERSHPRALAAVPRRLIPRVADSSTPQNAFCQNDCAALALRWQFSCKN
jgi:hypothetical protein